MKHPIRLTIAALLRDGKPRTARDVFEALRPQYPGERQLSPDAVDGHLQALKAVGIVRIAEETLEAGTLTQRYALSEMAGPCRALPVTPKNVSAARRKLFCLRSPMSCCTPTNPSGASGLSGAWPGCAPAIWPRSPTFPPPARWRAHGPRNLRAGGLGNIPGAGPASGSVSFYDIKHMDRPTGGSRARTAGFLDNLRVLFRMGKKVLIRMPLLPGLNDDPAGLEAAFAMLREEAAQGADIAGVELLP